MRRPRTEPQTQTGKHITKGLLWYHQVRRDAERYWPRDLRRNLKNPNVSAPVRTQLEIGGQDPVELYRRLGPDRVGPAERMLIEDTVALGVAMRLTSSLLYQNPTDGDLVSRMSSLANVRVRNLSTLGLVGETMQEPDGVAEYRAAIAAQRARAAEKTAQPEAQSGAGGDRAPEGNVGASREEEQ
jgi:hypothetical protein